MVKNPFPGMNPFLERHWGDVHSRLVLYSADSINLQLSGPLRARVEERLVVENVDTDESRAIRPDVRVFAPSSGGDGGVAVLEASIAAEPDLIQMAESEPETTTYLKIIDSSTGGQLVTVIEFLSPANKEQRRSKAALQYHAKRDELKLGGVSLVEVDLLRDGERFFPEYDERYNKCLRATYAACIRRSWRNRRYEVYSFNLRDRLPAIRIPLRQQDPDVVLDLQAVIDQVYEKGRYDDIDYSRPLDPPLNADDADWAKTLVAPAS